MSSTVPVWLTRFATRLRFPWLFAITAAVFLFDLLIPDLIPLADEILLGFATVLLASLRRDDKNDGPSSTPGADRSLPPGESP